MTTPHQEPSPGQEPASAEGLAPAESPAPAEGSPAGEPPAHAGKRSNFRSQLAFAGLGLGAGLVIGLLLGQLEFPQSSDAITTAVQTCDVESRLGINIGDEGQSISMQSEGMESAGAPYSEIVCVLTELETTDSVLARIDGTRALDGRLTGQWGEFSASWGYHPDNGLDIVVEVLETN